MDHATIRRIYQASYAGLCNQAFSLARVQKESVMLKKEFPEFAHIIHRATLDAIADYITNATLIQLTKCRTIRDVLAL
jgi:hypothetical protein